MSQSKILIDYDGVLTYIGKSCAGADENNLVWGITKIEHDATGKVISVTHTGNNGLHTYKWSERKTLEYE